MRYPSFIAEMGRPAARRKLWVSISSGYATALLFGALAAVAQALHAIPIDDRFYALVLFKIATNTVALVALRLDRGVIETAGLNILADGLAMTGAIYLTGGVFSPLLAMYAIEITIVALLSNVGVTVLVGSGILVLFTAMGIATHLGWLPQTVPLTAVSRDAGPLIAGLTFGAFVLAVPTFYCALILHLLRDREKELEQKTRELVEASRQKSQFMANVTHELRTPIHVIRGLSELVEQGVYGPPTERQKRAQENIRRSAQALLAMIDDLLTVAAHEAGRLALAPTEIDVGELVGGAVGIARWMKGARALAIAVEVEPGLRPLFSDRTKLNQVLLNLLTNAMKFTPDAGRVTLRAARDGDAGLAIAVEDTGIGMSPEVREHVFDDFWQADGSSERRYGGAGVGLGVVRRLTDLLGGRIEVRSAEGRGSTFTVKLPWKLTDQAPQRSVGAA